MRMRERVRVYLGHICAACVKILCQMQGGEMCGASQEVESNGNSLTRALSCLSSSLGAILCPEAPSGSVSITCSDERLQHQGYLTFERKPLMTGSLHVSSFFSLPSRVCVCVCVPVARED